MFLRRARVAGDGAAVVTAVPAPQQPGPAAQAAGATAAKTPRILRTALVASLVAGVLGSGMLVWGSSHALFSGKAMTPANSWAAGTVSISDDDTGTALFTVSGIMPGDSGVKCINVTYTGTVAAGVRLHAALTGTGLGPYVDLTVEQGTGGTFASCTSFAAEVSTTGTMAAFAAARTNYASGFGTWAPTAGGQSRSYRITWAMRPDNGGINKTANLALTWEAQG
jgi:hypothetical protein